MIAAALVTWLSGCGAEQSALAPFGAGSAATFKLTLILSGFALIIFLSVAGLVFHASRAPEGAIDHHRGMRIVLWLGAIGPAILLAVLLTFALPAMRPMDSSADDLRIAVDGRQFWWHVSYRPDADPANAVVTANEIRLPVGRTVVFELTATDVIHSFWIPGLAGKMDMLPGRTNQLVVRATKPGIYRGACAEFCGLSHALMALDVIAMEPAAFDRWLSSQRSPAPQAAAARGNALFEQWGCQACHSIRGAFPATDIGPDLTHFGARRTAAAGTLPMEGDRIAAFIRNSSAIKPGSRMPAFPDMTKADADALAAYLMALR